MPAPRLACGSSELVSVSSSLCTFERSVICYAPLCEQWAVVGDVLRLAVRTAGSASSYPARGPHCLVRRRTSLVVTDHWPLPTAHSAYGSLGKREKSGARFST